MFRLHVLLIFGCFLWFLVYFLVLFVCDVCIYAVCDLCIGCLYVVFPFFLLLLFSQSYFTFTFVFLHFVCSFMFFRTQVFVVLLCFLSPCEVLWLFASMYALVHEHVCAKNAVDVRQTAHKRRNMTNKLLHITHDESFLENIEGGFMTSTVPTMGRKFTERSRYEKSIKIWFW